MAKKITFDKESELLQAQIEEYSRQVQRILDKFADEVTKVVAGSPYAGKKYFRIEDYPETNKLFEKLQRKSASDIRHVVINGATALWEESNFRNDKFAQSILGNKALLEQYAVYFNNNADALNSFLKRQRNGLNLSQRIWRIEDEFKESFEAAITVAIQDGRSAAQLSRDVRKYLRDPDKLFRRIGTYGDDGNLKAWKLSQPALKYSPGSGMYRSSYKNAMRLAATEINIAYRTADQLRWEQMDFVVGYRIQRSKNPYPCPVCEALAGDYPKSFVFESFHPHCRCYCIPILKTEEEMQRDDELIMSGQAPSGDSVNKIDSVPENYKQWVNDNQDGIIRAQERGTLPYFLKDNPYSQYIDRSVSVSDFKSNYHDPKYEFDDIFDKVDYKYARQNYSNRVHEGKTYQGYIGEMQGYNDLPTLVSQHDFDKLKSNEDFVPIYRGFRKNADNLVESFKKGDLYQGFGAYGNGSYFGTNENIALSYTTDRNRNHIVQAVFSKKDVKMAVFEDLKDEWIKERSVSDFTSDAKRYFKVSDLSKVSDDDLFDFEGQIMRKRSVVYDDFGAWCTAKGYDMIYIESEDFYVMLNRTKLIVRK